jgi:hypothetical protein
MDVRRSHNKIGVLGVPFDKGQVIYNSFIPTVTSDCVCSTGFVDCDTFSFNF